MSIRKTKPLAGIGERFVRIVITASIALGLCIGSLRTIAQGVDAERPVVVATRIDGGQSPIIDGDVSDAIWLRAELVSRFYQIEPGAFSQPSERTEVRILYDSEQLYLSIYCFDSEPDKITATVKSRDGMMPRDDFVRVVLDPQSTRRDGYMFEISPLGGRVDGLIQNNSDILTNWNALWRGQARRVADGWTAEIAIPFRAISFDPKQSRWGFDIVRQIKRKSETIRLVSTDASVALADISLSGSLDGLENLSQGAGLDVQLYGTGRYTHDWLTHSSTRKFDPSATAYYKFTPALTGTLTFNPDFSNTPLDTRRVNTTRFSLFDPETRDFFLQDAAAFEFGGAGFSISNNGQPFFSRNIGLVGSMPVAVNVGAKVSGEAGPLRVGILNTRTEGSAAAPGQVLSVARLATTMFDESSLGMIVTHGDPTGATRNTVAGADFQFRNSDIGGGKRLRSDVYFERSYSNVRGNDNAFGVAVTYPNEPWYFDLYAKQVGQDFMPALGFVNRTGVRLYNNRVARRTRIADRWVRWYELSVANDVTTDLNDRLLSRKNSLGGELQNAAGDKLMLYLSNNFEFLDLPFTLPGDIVLPQRRYTWNTFNPVIETSAARPLFAMWSFECCRFYDGQYLANDLELNYRPSGTYDFSIHHVLNRIKRQQQSVNIHVGSIEVGVQFTPDMQLKLQLQYDNISERFRGLLRYTWEPKAGTEIFAAIGEDAMISSPLLRSNSNYRSQQSDALVRLGHRLQF